MSTKATIENSIAPVVIFTGGYGSGKSEIAVNYAMAAKAFYQHVAIADIDVVNPYFRSREAKIPLEEAGVVVIAPLGELSTSALPALPPGIERIMRDDTIYAIIDVGGDDVGARVLGRYENAIAQNKKMYLVVNTSRPEQGTVKQLITLAHKIMGNAQQHFDGVINNTNLLYETTLDLIAEGHRIVAEVAKQLNVPVVFTAIDRKLVDELGYPAVPTDFLLLNLQLSPYWRKN